MVALACQVNALAITPATNKFFTALNGFIGLLNSDYLLPGTPELRVRACCYEGIYKHCKGLFVGFGCLKVSLAMRRVLPPPLPA